MTFAIAADVLSITIWLYLLLARGSFWDEPHKCSTWNNCAKPETERDVHESCHTAIPKRQQPAVAVVMPARNEAATIASAVKSLTKQEYGGQIFLVVVDDDSDDGTADVAREAASRAGHPDRLTVINGQPPPAGWTGKVWAVQQGIEAARTFDPAFFLLTDGDVVHHPSSIATLVGIAEVGGYDLTSFMVRLHCESAAERLLIPAFVFFFFMLYPPRWIADPRKATAGAAGGCMLVSPAALERAGGMKAIRGEVIDDCALARAVKTAGGCIWLGLSEDLESARAYRGFADIGRMIARTAFSQLHHSGLMLLGALAGLAITFLAPLAAVFGGWPPTIALGALGWSLMTIAYLPMVRFYGLNPLWAATLPITASFYMGATIWSAVRYWAGHGGEWKGRAQDTRR